MKHANTVISTAVLVMLTVCFATAEEKPDPREKLSTAVPEAIRLLEKKKYVDFLKAFVSPDDLKMATKKGPIEEFAKVFGEKSAARLLKALKLAKEVEPTVDDEKQEAVYELKEEVDGRKTITFKKFEKFWYIQN